MFSWNVGVAKSPCFHEWYFCRQSWKSGRIYSLVLYPCDSRSLNLYGPAVQHGASRKGLPNLYFETTDLSEGTVSYCKMQSDDCPGRIRDPETSWLGFYSGNHLESASTSHRNGNLQILQTSQNLLENHLVLRFFAGTAYQISVLYFQTFSLTCFSLYVIGCCVSDELFFCA